MSSPGSPAAKAFARNVVLYGAIGALASGADAAVFAALTYAAGMESLAANLISVPAGMLISFTLNRKYNFKVEDHVLRRALIFFAVGCAGLCISQLILWVGTGAGAEPMVVKLFSIAVVAAVQFTLNKFVSFGLAFEDGA